MKETMNPVSPQPHKITLNVQNNPLPDLLYNDNITNYEHFQKLMKTSNIRPSYLIVMLVHI